MSVTMTSLRSWSLARAVSLLMALLVALAFLDFVWLWQMGLAQQGSLQTLVSRKVAVTSPV